MLYVIYILSETDYCLSSEKVCVKQMLYVIYISSETDYYLDDWESLHKARALPDLNRN